MPSNPPSDRHQRVSSDDGTLRFDDPWRLRGTVDAADEFPEFVTTLFAIGNGTIGIRSAPLGDRVAQSRATAIVNGFYESWTIRYPETAYGMATAGQTLLSAPNPTLIDVTIDGVDLTVETATRTGGTYELDMAHATLIETSQWNLDGRTITVAIERFASFADGAIVGLRAEAHIEGPPATVTFTSRTSLGHQSSVGGDPNDPRRSRDLPADSVATTLTDQVADSKFVIALETARSRLALGMAMADTQGTAYVVADDSVSAVHTVVGQSAVFERCVAVVLDQAATNTSGAPFTPPMTGNPATDRSLGALDGVDYTSARHVHRQRVAELWQRADVIVDTSAPEQQAIRYNIFQLLSAGVTTPTGIAAKGVTSNGYEGHFFWDTEMFMVPFWHHVEPARARHLLDVRHRQLPIARSWAQHLRYAGALFAWRTINGHEASAYFLAGTAQFHINADIAFAVDRFLCDYPDDPFVVDGVEILVEVARFFDHVGFVGDDGAFHVHGVTGPDEYTALVDDNYYTNRMTQQALARAAAWVALLQDDSRGPALVERTGVTDEEVDRWRTRAHLMHLPLDEVYGVRPQDATFLSKQRWPAHEGSHRALLLDQHPLTIYRHQLLKQPDVVLADLLFEHDEDPALLRRNFEYYDPITTGDSSLSAGIQSAMAARIGLHVDALAHFAHALYTDLDNLHDNTDDGIHLATAGTVWLALLWGFGGVRGTERGIVVDPRLPARWGSLSIPLLWRSVPLRVTIDHDHVTVENRGDRAVVVTTGAPHERVVSPTSTERTLTVAPGQQVRVPA